MILDKWIFTLPKFAVFGLFDVDLFTQGSIGVDPLRAFGTTYSDPGSQMVIGATAFALVSLVVVAIRRGRLGRRLIAMKDSEAACATLGMNLFGTKLLVFAISAGIAGLGGALYATQLTSIQAGNFDLVSSLQVFALTVVGGIGAVGGALFAGISLYVVLPLHHHARRPVLVGRGLVGRPAPRRYRHRPRPEAERRGEARCAKASPPLAELAVVAAGDDARRSSRRTVSASPTRSTTGRSSSASS